MGCCRYRRGVARAFFVNEWSAAQALTGFRSVTDDIWPECGSALPIGSQDSFRGVVDLVDMKAHIWEGNENLLRKIYLQIFRVRPRNIVRHWPEVVAETDDELTMKYLDGKS